MSTGFDPFRTAVPFWGQTTQILSSLPPKRDCSPKRVNARRATGLTVAEREESITRTGSMARWSRDGRAVYETESEALLFDFFFLDRCKVLQSGRKMLYERGRGFFFFPKFRFHFYWFCGDAVPCCALSFVHTAIYRKKIITTLPGVCTYVRHLSKRSGRNRWRREANVASELFSPEAWRWDSWHYQVASLYLRSS